MTVNFVSFFFLFNAVHRNLDPGQFLGIFHVKQIGRITEALEKEEIIF